MTQLEVIDTFNTKRRDLFSRYEVAAERHRAALEALSAADAAAQQASDDVADIQRRATEPKLPVALRLSLQQVSEAADQTLAQRSMVVHEATQVAAGTEREAKRLFREAATKLGEYLARQHDAALERLLPAVDAVLEANAVLGAVDVMVVAEFDPMKHRKPSAINAVDFDPLGAGGKRRGGQAFPVGNLDVWRWCTDRARRLNAGESVEPVYPQ